MRSVFLFLLCAAGCGHSSGGSPADSTSEEEYVVVVRHVGVDTLANHWVSIDADIDIAPHVKMTFPNLELLNVHAYVVSNTEVLAALRQEITVEYIERVSSFSVLPIEPPEDWSYPPDNSGYAIPDYTKYPLTTFLSSDSACTISYDHFRNIANLPDDALPSPQSILYVVDTGVDLQHPTFDGRAQWGHDGVTRAPHGIGDPHGHGTYVAGAIIGKHHGVARKSSVVDVRAIDAVGVGTTVSILSALDFIAGCASRDRSLLHVVTLSFTGERSVALRDAVRAMMEVAIFVGAIGDSSAYSCLTTPANIPDLVVVAGVDPLGNVMLPYSNFGECVSVKAPGLLTSATVPGAWAESASASRVDPTRGFEARVSSSAGAAALIAGLIAILGDNVQDNKKLSEAASFALKSRSIVNFMKNGSMLHFQAYGNDREIHKYPYVPCMIGEVDADWTATIERMTANIWATVGTTHVFSHFERVRKQFMESAKHNS